MNANNQTQPKKHEARELENIYEQYKRFIKSLYPESQLDKSYTEFVEWWNRLDSADRDRCASDFAKGYEQIVRESVQRRKATDSAKRR